MTKQERQRIKEYRRSFKTKEARAEINRIKEEMRANEPPEQKRERLLRERLAWISVAFSILSLLIVLAKQFLL